MYSSGALTQASRGLAGGGPFLECIYFQNKSGRQIVMFPLLKETQFPLFSDVDTSDLQEDLK